MFKIEIFVEQSSSVGKCSAIDQLIWVRFLLCSTQYSITKQLMYFRYLQKFSAMEAQWKPIRLEEGRGFQDPWLEMNYKRWLEFQMNEQKRIIREQERIIESLVQERDEQKEIIEEQQRRLNFLEEEINDDREL